jgi:hypothetical protein
MRGSLKYNCREMIAVIAKVASVLGLGVTLVHLLKKSRQEGLTILISSFLLAAMLQTGRYTHSITIEYEASLLLACTCKTYVIYFTASRVKLSRVARHLLVAFLHPILSCPFESWSAEAEMHGKFVFAGVEMGTMLFHFLFGFTFSTTRSIVHAWVQSHFKPSLGSRMYQWPYAIKVGAEVVMETSALTLITFFATVAPVIVLDVLVPSSLLDGSPEAEIVVKALGLAVLLASGAAVFADPTFKRQAPPAPAATRKSAPGGEGGGGWLSTFTWYNSWGYSGHRDLLLLSIPYLFLLFPTGANLLEMYSDYVIGGSWQSPFHMQRLVAFGWIELSYLLLGYFNLRGMLDLNAFDKEDQDGLSFAIPVSGGRRRTSSKQSQTPHRSTSMSGTPSSTTTKHSPARDGGNLCDLGSSSGSAFSTPLRHKKRGGDSGGRTHRSPSKEILAISMSPTRGSPPSDEIKPGASR